MCANGDVPALAKKGMAWLLAAMSASEWLGVTQEVPAQDHVAVGVTVGRGSQVRHLGRVSRSVRAAVRMQAHEAHLTSQPSPRAAAVT